MVSVRTKPVGSRAMTSAPTVSKGRFAATAPSLAACSAAVARSRRRTFSSVRLSTWTRSRLLSARSRSISAIVATNCAAPSPASLAARSMGTRSRAPRPWAASTGSVSRARSRNSAVPNSAKNGRSVRGAFLALAIMSG
jgi:hypothetical protein